MIEKVACWTDGACKGNPGPMGVGIMIVDQDKNQIRRWSKFLGDGTNNIAELTAIKLGLSYIVEKELNKLKVEVLTDSQYSIGVLSKNWKAKMNIELIMQIRGIMTKFPQLTFTYVKAHQNVGFNDVVDRLASSAAESGIEFDSLFVKPT